MKAILASRVTRVVVFAIVCTPAWRVSAQNLPDLPKPGEPLDDVKALAAKPTPKTADGHPDLSGRWKMPNTGQGGLRGRVNGNVHELIYGTPVTGDTQTDAAVTENLNKKVEERAKRRAANAPAYKPEFQAKVAMLAKDTNHTDPTKYSCLQSGVPRMGAPRMIVETPGLMILIYPGGYNTPNPYSTYRLVPTDGRAHRVVETDYDANPMGDPVGHWEGDTFVIETVGFDDTTWFGELGYFHSEAMKVIERITRKGDTIEYSAALEDPTVLTKPYNMNPNGPLVLKLGGPNDIAFNDDLPCDISDSAHDFRAHADHEHTTN